MSDAFDEKTLMDRVDGDLEFLEETIAMLDDDTPEVLEQIQSAVASHDASALVKPAHSIKGMLANFCAEPAETAARELEKIAREERVDEIDSAHERLLYEVTRLKEALHEFLRTKSV